MTSSSTHNAHDQLLAAVQLAQRRLSQLDDRIAEFGLEISEAFGERVSGLEGAARSLMTEISSWSEVEIGKSRAVTDLESGVDTLEADLEAMVQSIGPLYELAMDKQIRTWKSRLDELRLQGVLGAMEVKDDLGELTVRLDHARTGVLFELQNAVDDGKEVVADLRDDVEVVLTDVRHAVERAVAALSGA